MTRKEYLLGLISEECAEIIQRVEKARRFGLEEVQEGQTLNNEQRIGEELNDLAVIINLCFEEGIIKEQSDEEWRLHEAKKLIKLAKYEAYSKDLGIITD